MEIYNYTAYHNFISEKRKVWLNELCLDILPEFEDIETTLVKKETLSYGLFIDGQSAGRLFFQWMDGWKYEGNYFSEKEIKEIGRQIYFWIGLWE